MVRRKWSGFSNTITSCLGSRLALPHGEKKPLRFRKYPATYGRGLRRCFLHRIMRRAIATSFLVTNHNSFHLHKLFLKKRSPGRATAKEVILRCHASQVKESVRAGVAAFISRQIIGVKISGASRQKIALCVAAFTVNN